jgi:hypothetical protein
MPLDPDTLPDDELRQRARNRVRFMHESEIDGEELSIRSYDRPTRFQRFVLEETAPSANGTSAPPGTPRTRTPACPATTRPPWAAAPVRTTGHASRPAA